MGIPLLRIDADDPAIDYTGRIDFSEPKAPCFAYPGVAILAAFEGGSIDAVMEDSGDGDYFNISIDGRPCEVFRSCTGESVFRAGRGLGPGTHTIRVVKRTESLCGTATFKGFAVEAGAGLSPVAGPPERRIEFIGDSITCGYGDLVSTDHPELCPFTNANEDCSIAWGALTAEALGARFVATAYSGRGVFRNYDATERGTLPELYRDIFPDRPGAARWDPSRYVPDVIVVNLGTNDYNSLLMRDDMSAERFDKLLADAYRSFVVELRRLYPAAKIVCAVGPMLSDDSPAGKDAWTRIQAAVSGLVVSLQKGGDAAVYYLALAPQSGPYGEDWHPSAATQARAADTAIGFIRSVTGWRPA